MDKHVQQLRQQQDALLEQMRQCRLMYGGTLTEQHYPARRARKGGEGATGPYYLWQGSKGGERFSRRVGAREAQDVKEGIEARHGFEELCARYVALGEALAQYLHQKHEAEEALKKKSKSPLRGASR